jgi:hypothetical protein
MAQGYERAESLARQGSEFFTLKRYPRVVPFLNAPIEVEDTLLSVTAQIQKSDMLQ